MKAKVQLYGMGYQELKYPILYDLFTISLPLKYSLFLYIFTQLKRNLKTISYARFIQRYGS